MENAFVLYGLSIILLAVLVLPFFFHKVEKNLEAFLFAMGVSAVFVSNQFSWHLTHEALVEPIPISLAVLGFGLLFKWTRRYFDQAIQATLKKVSIPVLVFLLIAVLGAISSFITAIIAALVLVEVISMLRLNKDHERYLVIIACFSIGFGAVLTPLGEPLSTIAIAKLKSWPGVDFWYLARLLGWEVLGAILLLAFLSVFFHGRLSEQTLEAVKEERDEPYRQIALRSGKVYLFVMALVFLGQGFKPVIDTYITQLSSDLLYWLNITSAVLDNATLTAAEISPSMSVIQVKKILIGLLVAGGMLVPGNIPNIIAASKLGITMKQWAKLGVPLGLAIMLLFFFILKLY